MKFYDFYYEQTLQCVEEDNGLDNGKENLETIFFIIVNDGWPSLECHSDEVVLTLENASYDEEVTKGNVVGHSYMPSLGSPIKRITLVFRSFTWKAEGENSTETWLLVQNW